MRGHFGYSLQLNYVLSNLSRHIIYTTIGPHHLMWMSRWIKSLICTRTVSGGGCVSRRWKFVLFIRTTIGGGGGGMMCMIDWTKATSFIWVRLRQKMTTRLKWLHKRSTHAGDCRCLYWAGMCWCRCCWSLFPWKCITLERVLINIFHYF